jgi:hypothetical protein
MPYWLVIFKERVETGEKQVQGIGGMVLCFSLSLFPSTFRLLL